MKSLSLLAAAVLLVPLASAQAAVTVTGSVTPATDPATWTSGTTVKVGTGFSPNNAPGTITVDGGTTLATSVTTIGDTDVGVATVTGAGTNWTSAAGTFAVGSGGAGTLNLTNGALLTTNVLGAASGTASGIINITNATATGTTGGSFNIGQSANGTLNVNAGGKVIVYRNSAVGNASTGTGTVNVIGAGAEVDVLSNFVNASGLKIGNNGSGTMTVATGGLLKFAPSLANTRGLSISTLAGSTGILNLQAGGTIDMGGVIMGVGVQDPTGGLAYTAGTGTFNFTGGTLLNAPTIKLDNSTSGGLVQTGGLFSAGTSGSQTIGTTAITGTYGLGAAGTLEVDLANAAGIVGTSSDYYTVSGAATLSGTISMVALSGFSVDTAGVVFNVLTAPTISTTGLSIPGYTYSVISGGAGQILQATSVPEPTTLAVLGLGAVSLIARRRRA